MEDSAQYEEFSNLHAESERNKRVKDDTYKENSKRRLLNNLKKKFDTTIIGSLAALRIDLESYGGMVFLWQNLMRTSYTGERLGQTRDLRF